MTRKTAVDSMATKELGTCISRQTQRMEKSSSSVLAKIGAERRFLLCYVRHLGASWADAEDVTQNALIRAVESQSDFKGTDREHVRAWLSTIARNAYFDFRRRAKSQRRRAELCGERSVRTSMPSAGEHACALQDVERGLMRMRPESRETFCLQALGIEYSEIAARSGSAVGTVKSRIARAREALSA